MKSLLERSQLWRVPQVVRFQVFGTIIYKKEGRGLFILSSFFVLFSLLFLELRNTRWSKPLPHPTPPPKSQNLNLPYVASFIGTCILFMRKTFFARNKEIEDISWPRGDTNFIFECWKYLSRVSEANEWEILSAREDKIRIPKRSWNVLFII